MRRWLLVALIEDDGIEDPYGDVKGRYFTKTEIMHDFGKHNLTAGLQVRIIELSRVKRRSATTPITVERLMMVDKAMKALMTHGVKETLTQKEGEKTGATQKRR